MQPEQAVSRAQALYRVLPKSGLTRTTFLELGEAASERRPFAALSARLKKALFLMVADYQKALVLIVAEERITSAAFAAQVIGPPERLTGEELAAVAGVPSEDVDDDADTSDDADDSDSDDEDDADDETTDEETAIAAGTIAATGLASPDEIIADGLPERGRAAVTTTVATATSQEPQGASTEAQPSA